MTDDMRIEYECVLPRRVAKQPQPKLYPEGDCGPCVLTGIMGRTDPSYIYQTFNQGKIEPLSHSNVRQILADAKQAGLIERYIDDFPSWPVVPSRQTFGSPAWMQSLAWFKYIRMGIDGGYYGLCAINMNAGGPLMDTDHFVMICGIRETFTPHPTMEGTGTFRPEILVSCSAHHPEGCWYPVVDFLQRRGGFNVFLVKPPKE